MLYTHTIDVCSSSCSISVVHCLNKVGRILLFFNITIFPIHHIINTIKYFLHNQNVKKCILHSTQNWF